MFFHFYVLGTFSVEDKSCKNIIEYWKENAKKTIHIHKKWPLPATKSKTEIQFTIALHKNSSSSNISWNYRNYSNYSRKCSGKKFRLCHSCFGTFWLKLCPLDVTSDNGLPAKVFAMANIALLPFPTEQGDPTADGGLILFSFCLLLQNHTLTTSFSMHKLSARSEISSDVGLGFAMKAFSKATLTLVSIEVLFFLRLPMASGVVMGLLNAPGLFKVLSASSSHFCRSGFNLHMFLKLRLRASNLDIVVWEKSLPYNLPIAKPTSPWVNPETNNTLNTP